jgi:hypothetical protein
MQEIDIKDKLSEFKVHLEQNPRVILSAKFGDGKTTFLRTFIESNKDTIYPIVLHPVNYSVAKNEDVFEYVKHDILLQLCNDGQVDDIDVDAVCSSLKDKILTSRNVLILADILAEFLPASEIWKKIIEKLKEQNKNLREWYERYKEQSVTASKYIENFRNISGGLYEEDAYTSLIQASLKKIKKSRKVLIIEDIDRMDPQHLFRVLNVLAAHIDVDKETNKFGFDNMSPL